MKTPITRYYFVRAGSTFGVGEWARIWITDDGCFTTISDHGNWGYWWSHPGCEFRKFLCRCDADYLGRKLAQGEREFDGEASVLAIRWRILEWRRERSLTREQAHDEWELVHPEPSRSYLDPRGRFSSMDNEIEAHEWYLETKLADPAELLAYRIPLQLQMFLKHLWPLFVRELKRELREEYVEACIEFRERSHEQLSRAPDVIAALSGDD